MKVFLIVVLALSQVLAEPKRYDNYRRYNLTPTSFKGLETLHSLEKIEGYEFYSYPSLVNVSLSLIVPPNHLNSFKNLMESNSIKMELINDNIQDLIDLEKSANRKIVDGEMDWTSYRTLEEINSWMDQLAKDYPEIVKIQDAGKTYENRTIKGVYLSFNSSNSKRAIFLEGNIHAREWISSATVTYILNQLLTSTDPAVRDLAESHDWYIFPIFNPDGFAYTHEKERLWRKTRVPYGNCFGSDPNRNWDYHWMDGGASDDSCSDIYAGPKAFSEPSSKSLSEYISRISDKLIGYISFHSFGQLILIPYGYSSEHLDNYEELEEIGLRSAKSLAQRYNTDYVVGNIVDVLYVASGGSVDWVKGTFKTPLTFTFELRDTGRYGFILPPDQIIPTGEETLDALVTMFEDY